MPVVPPARRAQMRAWAAKNPTKNSEYCKRYAAKNAAKIAARKKAKRSETENKLAQQAYAKEYHSKNSEARNQKSREWYHRNKEKVSQRRSLWSQENAHKCRLHAMNRHAAKLRATPWWADMDKIAAFYAEADRLTRETGIKHEVDHIYPLKGKNSCGLHVETNLQILTKSQNSSKGNREPESFLSAIMLQSRNLLIPPGRPAMGANP